MTTPEIQSEIERNFRFNATVGVIEGAAFWFGANFVSAQTILPLYVSRFTDSKMLLGLLAAMSTAGWLIPQIFTVNWAQRLPRKKFGPVNVGLWIERLPVFLMVPAALLAVTRPTLSITSFFLLFAWQQLGIGLIAVAWQAMLAKVIPADRRGRFLGVTTGIGTVTGMVGAGIAARFLQRYPFPYGYVYCFTAGAVLAFVSWFFLSLTREPADEDLPPRMSQLEFFKGLPKVLREDANFSRFLLGEAVMNGSTMATGFLAVYAVQHWGLSDTLAGMYAVSLLVGQAICNLLFGVLADRRGHKIVLEISALSAVLAAAIALVAPAPFVLHASFALVGCAIAGFYQSGMMIAMEFGRPEIRTTYVGMNSTVRGASTGIAPLIGGWLAGTLGYSGLFVAALVMGLAGFAIMHFAVLDPRVAGARSESTATAQAVASD